MATVHVVGAGLAGLAAAVELARAGTGWRVVVHEAAPHAGGRCRSYHDALLDLDIDNGNHLILGANPAVFAYRAAIGARGGLYGPPDAAFPFLDLATGEHWRLQPSRGRIPWWVLAAHRRVPGTRAADYLGALRLLRAGPDDTVADCLDTRTVLYRRLWEPLTVAVMNAGPEEASARLMAGVLRATFGGGAEACRPYIATDGLGPALVDPALAWLSRNGVEIRHGDRLRALTAGRLEFTTGPVDLAPADRVVLALPAAVTGRLLPLTVPEGSRAILNAHFRLSADDPGPPQLVGLVGGMAQWVFRRGLLASVTVSAADGLLDRPEAELVASLWPEVAQALDLAGPAPPVRLVREKRATFLQNPRNAARRPAAGALGPAIALAGDWTDTGLPATLEGAVRSGVAAAAHLLANQNVTAETQVA